MFKNQRNYVDGASSYSKVYSTIYINSFQRKLKFPSNVVSAHRHKYNTVYVV